MWPIANALVLSVSGSIRIDPELQLSISVEEELARYGRPGIFNTDQRSQFTQPIPLDSFGYQMVWHERAHSDDGSIWLRQQVFEASRHPSSSDSDQ